MNDTYDAIVIGSGAGGGVAACVLAEAGQRVLLLERGRKMSYADVGRDHLRNHRLSKYGHNTGPDVVGNPRVWVDARGKEHVVLPHEGAYHNNAMAVGGGTLVYGAQAWRFLPTDFRMASTYGTPAGSSLSDWPVSYDDVAPFYERAEWEIGVAGDGALAGASWPRAKGYPLPPLPDRPSTRMLRGGARHLGWPTVVVPVLINTRPYNGRPPCVQCGRCVGFACPSDGKKRVAKHRHSARPRHRFM